MSVKPVNRFDRYIEWSKNHWLISILLFIVIIIFGANRVMSDIFNITTIVGSIFRSDEFPERLKQAQGAYANQKEITLQSPQQVMHVDRILVLPFKDNSQSKHITQRSYLARDLLTNRLNDYGEFDIVERERLDVILREMEFSRTGIVNQKDISKFGNILGASVIAIGSIDDIRTKTHNFTGYNVNIETTTIITNISIQFVDISSTKLIDAIILQGNYKYSSTDFGTLNYDDAVFPSIQNAIESLGDLSKLKKWNMLQKKK